MSELFDVGERKPAERPAHKYPTPDLPGTGPEGETCGSCRFCVNPSRSKKRFLKCAKMTDDWTHGTGTDIKAKWAACSKWESRLLLTPEGRMTIRRMYRPHGFSPRDMLTNDGALIAADYWEDAGGTHQAAMLRAVVEAERT